MKYILLLALSFTLVQCTCKRTTDTLGPSACPSDTFAVTTAFIVQDHAGGPSSQTNLDLSTSYADITAAFNEVITYKITIVGQTSGAEYDYNGKGSVVNLQWYGNSTNGKYYSKGELLVCKLTNICKTEPLGNAQITLTTIVGYNGFGVKVVNFEESPPVTMPQYGDLFAPPCGASLLMTPSSSGYTASPQGGNYYKYKASCTSAAAGIAWYFGGADFSGINYPSLGADPTNVYLNFFAKGQKNSQAQIIIKETVYGTVLTRKYLANVGDSWTLYSAKLSDIGIINPANISSVSFNLGAALVQDTSAEVDLDLLIFTFEKPF